MSPFGAGADTLHIRSARMRGSADALGARQRLEAAVTDVRPSALGLSAHAVLIVRRVAPALRLRLDPRMRTAAFGGEVRAQLAACMRRARRPWLHADAANADAVLFVDEAELIACLVRDWSRARVAERWWWASLLRGMSATEWLRRMVSTRGEVLPAVFAHLASHGDAVAWLVQWSDVEAARAVEAIAAAHALPLSTAASGLAPVMPQIATAPAPATATLVRAREAAYQRLLASVPELHAAQLTTSKRGLLALALGLARASAWVRGDEFAVAWRQIEATAPIDSADDVVSASRAEPARNPEAGAAEQKPAATRRRAEAGAASGALEALLAPARQRPSQRSRVAHALRPPPPLPADAAPRSTADVAAPLQTTRDDPAIAHSGAQTDAAPPATGGHAPQIASRVASALPPVLADAGIDTQFGGIFYLLNAALALGLYADFTGPRASGIALSPWDLLALVGRAWFGREFERDPVCSLLAALAGRTPQQRPGAAFAPEPHWAVPQEWLAPWDGAGRLGVYAGRTRIEVWHPAGFVLADDARSASLRRSVPRPARDSASDARTDALARARECCAAYEALWQAELAIVRARPHKLLRAREPLDRWLGLLLLYLRARLSRALGVEADAALPRLVCCHAATLHITSTALDVHMRLDTLPLAIRIAGLDRDPGWIPAAGRSIAFHFA